MDTIAALPYAVSRSRRERGKSILLSRLRHLIQHHLADRKMKSIFCIIFSMAALTLARVHYDINFDRHPQLAYEMHRPRRDTTFMKVDRNIGSGKVTGELGENAYGLYGKGGYERNIFDNSRGKLDGQVHGTRVLGPFGDSSQVGGGLSWQTNNAVTGLDLNKEIGGRTRLDATYGGKWHLDPRTDFSLKGGYSQTFPGSGPEVMLKGEITFP